MFPVGEPSSLRKQWPNADFIPIPASIVLTDTSAIAAIISADLTTLCATIFESNYAVYCYFSRSMLRLCGTGWNCCLVQWSLDDYKYW